MDKQGSKGSSYKHVQLLGYKGPNQKVMEEDIISCVKFDQTGKFLSLGDKAGRIIIFQDTTTGKKKDQAYEYFTQFQSHIRQFDHLKSMDVEQEITSINWMNLQGKYQKIITTNNRTIKVWKVSEQTEKKVVKSSGKELTMPKLQSLDTSYVAQSQKVFPNIHLTPINSVSTTRNEEYLLSSDEVQNYLWSLQNPSKPYIVYDLLQGQKLEDIKENITCSKMHPQADNLFIFATNKGTLKMVDLRNSVSNQSSNLSFKVEVANSQKNYFTEMLSGYSSIDFIKNGKYLISRDMMTVKIWDTCNTKKPVSTVVVHESLKSKLCEMFENDCMDDKFNISASPDGNTILTGNYNNSFHMIDVADSANTQYELNYKKQTVSKVLVPGKCSPISKMDYLRKTTASDFNTKRNMLAVASLNCFYIYSM